MNQKNRLFWIGAVCLLVLCIFGGVLSCAALFRQDHMVSVERYWQADIPEDVTARLSELGWCNEGKTDTAVEELSADEPVQTNSQPEQPANTPAASDHSHAWAKEPQTVKNPVTGYCGNIVTSVSIDEKNYSFWGSESVALTNIIINLQYDAQKCCVCEAELYVDTEWENGYEINLTKGFVRSADGQADLTQEQTDQIREVLRKLESGEMMLLG